MLVDSRLGINEDKVGATGQYFNVTERDDELLDSYTSHSLEHFELLFAIVLSTS